MTTAPTNPLEVRMARLEGSYEQIDKRLSAVETQVSEVRSELSSFRADVDTKLNGLRTLIFSAVGALGLLITIYQFLN